MGKRKSKGGITGLSHFVAVLHQDQAVAQQTLSSVNSTVQDPKQSDAKCEGHHGDEGHQLVGADSKPAGAIVHTIAPGKNAIRYDATGLVPTYNDVSQVPEHLKKYFSQRTRFFSLYDKPPGCLLDEEGWYSITPERIADQIAERCRCDVILDAFCGVGGNTIAFAKTCERVIALDTNSTRLALARHNAQIYGVADRIEFIQADYISFARAYLLPSSSSSPPISTSPQSVLLPNKRRKIDAVFLSPPWGGPTYLTGPNGEAETTGVDNHPTYSLSAIQPIHGKDLFTLTRQITPNIAYYLPRNTNLTEISDLLNDANEEHSVRLPGEQVEVEEEWMGSKLKALTCYFGGLAAGQDHLF
ncbi:S-adenosyl-L-methionine-dependent methyltransferase [Macrolepiota fuliginosa MF-IS2]|uniref:Trimethylguanosine synthase n=1 Tax=Macrolepiota fuliginosa MF-IS2 TaxID=1400762 RepID=A0A9P6C6X5_9AGAR|nr:S-adenosyl-L-methionine-dependent methyltransferase [Macrolepiota fuliginosa MF-IS2]